MACKKPKLAEASLVYGEGTEKLSQLSDIISLSQEAEPGSQPLVDVPFRCSQPDLADLQEPLPSQAVLPTPELSSELQRVDDSGAREPERSRSRLGGEPREEMLLLTHSPDCTLSTDTRDRKRRLTRRGPMDEMRQLVRILVKIIPQSAQNVKASEEGGGGNRISEDQIKGYLTLTLGDAPHPKWGVPDGWGSYLAELFSWVTGRPVTKSQAMQCAKRDPGRSWEAIDGELARLGLLPSTWPLPLSKESMGSALIPTSQEFAIPRLLPPVKTQSPKRSADYSSRSESPVKRHRMEASSACKQSNSEVALWSEVLQLAQAAQSKAASRPLPLESQMMIAKLKAEISAITQGSSSASPQPASVPLFLSSQAPHVVPISLAGPNGHVQTAYTFQLHSSGLATAASSSLGLEPSNSLELGGMNPSQFLLSQPGVGGNSAFQAVKPASPEKQSRHERQSPPLLDSPPPLRLSQNPSQASGDGERAPSSPSTEEEDNSAVFNPSQLASPHSGPVSNLFKPTALKSDPSIMERTASQSETRPVPMSSPPHADIPGMPGVPPVLGYFCNGHFVPLSGPSPLHNLANPMQPSYAGQPQLGFFPAPASFSSVQATQPAMLSQALENARLQANPWVPNLAATLH